MSYTIRSCYCPDMNREGDRMRHYDQLNTRLSHRRKRLAFDDCQTRFLRSQQDVNLIQTFISNFSILWWSGTYGLVTVTLPSGRLNHSEAEESRLLDLHIQVKSSRHIKIKWILFSHVYMMCWMWLSVYIKI
jgi:hypothetical protein